MTKSTATATSPVSRTNTKAKVQDPIPGVPTDAIFAGKWQGPLVDVFRSVHVGDDGAAKFQGDIRRISDRSIGKSVFQLRGLVPAANYIQIPENSSASLGLTGCNAYVQLRPNPARHFCMHFDLHTSNPAIGVRLSFSNLFREKKSLGRIVQVPVTLFRKRWTVFAINLKAIVEANTAFKFVAIKSIQLCASMHVRSVFTSSNIYTPSGIPREMCLPLSGQDWMSVYDWLWCPRAPAQVKTSVPPAQAISPVRKASNSQNRHERGFQIGQAASDENEPPLDAGNDGETQVSDNFNPKMMQKDFLHPDPILELSRLVGFNGTVVDGVNWARETNDTVVYACNNSVIRQNLSTSAQTTLMAHTSDICLMATGPHRRLLCTGETGASPFLFLWNLETGAQLARLPAFTKGLTAISFSSDATMLAAVGKDNHGRVQIVVWDITDRPTIIAKQTSDVSIARIAFSTYIGCEHELATCGTENIRFWRIKNAHLPGHSLVLNEHSRHRFTALKFEAAFSATSTDHNRTLFVGTDSGALFRIDAGSRALLCVYQLHSAAIVSVAVSEGFCVTGSADRLVRVWPLSFDEYIMEAEHETGVTSVSLSSDGLKVVVGSSGGTVGVLDIPKESYVIHVRSHVDKVAALALSPLADEFASASADNTIRVWDLHSLEQLYEFRAEGETASALVYHPSANELVCGFQSGLLRVFDIATLKLKAEFRQHSAGVVHLAMTADGRRLFSAASDRQICVFDVVRNYEPVRMMGAALPAISLNASGTMLAAPGPVSASELVLYDVETFLPKIQLDLPSTSLKHVAFAPEPVRQLLVVTADNRFVRFDTDTGAIVGDVLANIGFRTTFTAMAISKNGRFVFTVDSRRKLRVWNFYSTQSPMPSQIFLAHSQAPASMLYLPDKRLLSTGGSAILVWNFAGADESAVPAPPLRTTLGGDTPTPPASTSSSHERCGSVSHGDHRREASALSGLVSDEMTEKPSEKPLNVLCTARPRCAGAAVVYPSKVSALSVRRMLGFSSDGRQCLAWHASSGLFSYGCGRNIVFEDLRSHEQRILSNHSCSISVLSASPDGLLIAAGEGDKDNIYIYDVASLQLLYRFRLHRDGVQALEFNASSRFLVSVGSGTVGVWDLRDGSKVCSDSDMDTVYYSVAWVTRSSHQFVTTEPTKVTLFTVGSANPTAATRSLSRETVTARVGSGVQFTSVAVIEQKFVLCGCSNGDVIAFDMTRAMASSGSWRAMPAEVSFLQALRLRPSQHLGLIACGPTGAVHRWSISTRANKVEPLSCDRITLPDSPTVTAVRFESSGTIGVVGTSAGTVLQVSFEAMSVTRLVNGHPARVLSLQFCPADATLLATAGSDGSLRIWRTTDETSHQILQYQVPVKACQTLQFSPSGRVLASGYDDGHVRFVDIHSLAMVGSCVPEDSPVAAVSYILDGSFLVVGTDSGAVHLVNTHSCEVVFDIRDHHGSRIECIDTSTVLSTLYLITDCTGVLSVWKADHLEGAAVDSSLLRIVSVGSPDDLAFEPPAFNLSFKAKMVTKFSPCDADVILYSAPSSSPELMFYNYRSNQIIRRVSLPHVAMAMDIGRDGELIAVGSVDCMLTIMDYESGEYQDAAQHDDCITAVGFDTTGRKLASGSFAEVFLHSVRQYH